MNVLGIIPARGGSKRLRGKNRRRLGGKPLVAWTIEAALSAARIDRLVVSSDDEEILAIAGEYSSRIPLRRPADLAGDTSTPIEYVRHALSMFERRGERHFDAVAILQPSSPLTSPDDIDATLELLEASGAETAVTVMQVEHALHPVKFKRLEGATLLPYMEAEAGRMMAHELPEVFVRNGSVYATRRDVLDRGVVISDDSRAVVMPRERSVDINDAMDLRFAEFLVSEMRADIEETERQCVLDGSRCGGV